MGNSLLEQLKKSGLVSEKQVRQMRHGQQQQEQKGQPDGAGKTKELARNAQQEKLERDRQLNQQRQEEAQRKATAAQIRELIERHRIVERDGEIAYHFTDGTLVKRIHINANVHKQLCNGDLAIAKLGSRHELVPCDVATKISERDASRIITLSKSEKPAEDDPYAAYKVPDDLMW